MKKITLFTMAMLYGITAYFSQSASVQDWNAYVDSKNSGPTGYYTLVSGSEEFASQTYFYSGPGKVSQVKVYGHYPFPGGVPLRIAIYTVDIDGRPVAEMSHTDDIFWYSDNSTGYITVTLPSGGTSVSSNFAVVVSIKNSWPYGNSFQLKYTGDGEGQGQDLASLSGTSTGFNWTSAKDNFTKDGDFYLVPKMTHFNTPLFNSDYSCVSTNSNIQFTNLSAFTKDSMFNKMALSSYSGSNYFYSWNFGDGSVVSHQENPMHQFTSAGSYTVTLTTKIEGWGMTGINTYSKVYSVGLNVNSVQATNPSCNGQNSGSISVVGSGGTSPFTFSLNGGLFQTSSSFSNLPAGNYTITIKDANRCTNSVAVVLFQPLAITFPIVNSSNANCGSSNGSLFVSASGGVGAFQYKLNNGSFQSSGSFTGLSAGSYTVTAKDGNGCTNTTVVLVNNFGSPTLSVVSSTNVSCHSGNDATIVLNGTGGVGTLLYSINGGQTFQTSGSFLGLAAGTYAVLVKDASGCTSGRTIVISEPNPITYSVSSSETLCNGSADGQIQVAAVSGGIGTFAYSINGLSYQSSPNFSGLSSGTYTVFVKDAAMCTVQQTVTVNQPAPIQPSLSVVDAGCNGYYTGSITINASGGSAPFTYSINQGDPQPENLFDNLGASTYTVLIMDANNCTYSVTSTVSQPPILNASISTTNSTCGSMNGAILAIANGGSGSGYQYSLDGITYNSTGSFTNKPAGIYYVIVRDGTGCHRILPATIMDSNGPVITSSSFTDVGCFDGMDGTITVNTVSGGTGNLQYSINGIVWQSGTSFVGLSAGIYTVYVKDVNGCIGTETISISEPNAFVITKAITNVTCNGASSGSATIFAAGGSGAMAYSLDNGNTYQSSNTFSNLSAGAYLVKVRDAAGCYGFARFTITQPNPIAVFTGHLDVSCHGMNNGQITVYASGGTGTLSYSLDGINYQSSAIFSGLAGANYVVFVKDGNSCVKTSSVVITEPFPLLLIPVISNVSCAGGNDGVIDLSVLGGAGINTFVWSNGAVTEDLFNLSAGNYSVGVTDKNGCASFASFTVTEPTSPIIVNAVVNGTPSNTGSIDATITGGTQPYTFSWNNGATTEDITSLTPGYYILTVTDALGCITTAIYFVDNTTGIASHSNTIDEILIYPNPANDIFYIRSPNSKIEIISIYNSVGQLLFESKDFDSKNGIHTDLYESGIYLVVLKINGEVEKRRLQILR